MNTSKESVMKIWKSCRFDTLYYHDGADVNDECDVVIDGEYITVSYDADGLRVTYFGLMKGNGHFELQAPDVNGRATLHRFDDGRTLEGYWVEGELKGMWRITLHGIAGIA
jgi:hypothetical protein